MLKVYVIGDCCSNVDVTKEEDSYCSSVHKPTLCGLVVRVPGYRSRGPRSIPVATKFSEKQWIWNGVHSAS
jgi:hypothetical protein